jgi:glycosyltransferase involved in cell wall biosynthesis
MQARVVAAVPWFPGWYSAEASVPPSENFFGFEVRHPRYLHVPALGMRMQPYSLAKSLLNALAPAGGGANQFDLIDAHYFYPDGVAAALVAKALDVPLVISARGSDINLIAGISFARKRMLHAASRAEALIAVSRALSERMVSIGMPAERISVLRNGVDAQTFVPFPRREARARLGMHIDARWVLGVGNLVAGKRFDVLIKALESLPDVRLLLVGEGPERSTLASLADAIAPSRVEFRDNMRQSDLRFAYAACDVLGLPSEREGWPNVVLEAIACGTPVVATPVGGIPEILGRDAPGVLVGERDPARWASVLRTLLDASLHPDQVRRYALQFGWEDVVGDQCALYERVVSTYRRRTQQARR